MMSEDNSINPAHKTPQEIMTMEDAGEVETLLAVLEANCAAIESELEWSDKDESWARRAVTALAHKRGQIKACNRRLNALRPPAPVVPQKALVAAETTKKAEAAAMTAQANAQAAQAKAQSYALHVENQRLARQKALEDNFRRSVALIENVSLDHAFKREARKVLPADVFEQIEDAAQARVTRAAEDFINKFNRDMEAAQ